MRVHTTVRGGLVALVLLLGGCATDDPGPDAAPTSEASPEPGESGAQDTPDPDAPDPDPDAADPEAPDVPPLHPDTDRLDETVITIATTAGEQVRVDAKVAATEPERRFGLMEVEDLPDGAGMLFVFDEDRSGGFWMMNTLVPLDIAYIDADGTIGTIMAMDPCVEPEPEDCPSYVPDEPYRYALEVPQGWFAQEGVAVGDEVTWTEPVPAPATAS